ncbi:MAG: hypothetical protein M3R69_19340 [Acidobacteriota bacterium]|nr:hypothetical protein [Acidobacteriota bacterium]
MRLAGNRRTILRGTKILLLFGVLWVPTLRGQESYVQQTTAPPPLKIITRLERSQLNETKDLKARLKTTIELAETHLTNAEAQTSLHEYDNAAAEAGKYWALIDDAFDSLKGLNRESNKTRDLYKRLELTLRAHGPRISAMRRGTPAEYAVWLKEIEDFARSGRTEALNSFYGHTVVRESQQKPLNQKDERKPQKNSMTPEPKHP